MAIFKTIVTEEGRECTRCGEFKEWKFFAKKTSSVTGRTPHCKLCQSEINKPFTRKYSLVLKIEVLLHYATYTGIAGCVVCGETDPDMLCIDHVNDDGAEQRRINRRSGGTSMYVWLKANNWPEGYQVLCFNHNQKKEMLRRRGESWGDYVRKNCEEKRN